MDFCPILEIHVSILIPRAISKIPFLHKQEDISLEDILFLANLICMLVLKHLFLPFFHDSIS